MVSYRKLKVWKELTPLQAFTTTSPQVKEMVKEMIINQHSRLF